MIRISLGLLLYFQEEMLCSDIVQLSLLMKDIRSDRLQTAAERQRLLELILSTSAVTEASYANQIQCYEIDSTERFQLDTAYLPTMCGMEGKVNGSDKHALLKERSRIDVDIKQVRAKLEEISEREYALKQEFRKYSGIYALMDEERVEMAEYKRGMLNQVESLLYLDQHMLFDPGGSQGLC